MKDEPRQGGRREGIFISYRRDDARGASGRVWDWLRIGFGKEQVFRDVASIGAGKWRERIDQSLASSAACVAVIGRRWADGTNLPRLLEPGDMVRHELESALASGERGELTVLPLLVEEASLAAISIDELPESLRPLLQEWNVLELSESGWDDDTRRLISAIAEATGLPVRPDLEEWLALMGGAERGLATRQRPEAVAQAPQALGSEQLALEALLAKVASASPAERDGLKVAFAALAAGNTLVAEQEFEREVEASGSRVASLRELLAAEQRNVAEAARNVASLAAVRGDLTKAVRFLQMALKEAPDDLAATIEFGFGWMGLGSLEKAERSFREALAGARAQGDAPLEAKALSGIGDVLVARGEGVAALAAYREALEIRHAVVLADPAGSQWQRDLSVSHDRIGDVLLGQGDGRGALASYREALSIRQALMQKGPPSTQARRDLSVSHTKIGDGLLAQGDGTGALASYREGLAISDALAGQDPANTLWQRDLLVGHNKVAGVLKMRGEAVKSLTSYRAALAIATCLALRDPANTQWQRDLSVSHNRLGDMLLGQGDGHGALASYKEALAITETLAQRDSSNSEWQRDLAVGRNRIGDLLLAQAEIKSALAEYEQGLAIRHELASQDPHNVQWQRDLFVSHIKVGDGLLGLGDGPAALAAYRKGHLIVAGLAERNSEQMGWQRDLFVSFTKIGDVLANEGDGDGALSAYRSGVAIAESLANSDPANIQWQLDIAVSCAKAGTVESVLEHEHRQCLLSRGREIQLVLKQAGKLPPSQDWIEWFDDALMTLDKGSDHTESRP
jgi:tetratricopeptide (TPR) repeat protein